MWSRTSFARSAMCALVSRVSGSHNRSSSEKPGSSWNSGNILTIYDAVRRLSHVWIPFSSRQFCQKVTLKAKHVERKRYLENSQTLRFVSPQVTESEFTSFQRACHGAAVELFREWKAMGDFDCPGVKCIEGLIFANSSKFGIGCRPC